MAAIRSSVLVGTLLSIQASPLSAQAPDNPLLRWQYFYEQRSFPSGAVPPGALQRARQQMLDRWPELILRRDNDATAAFELSASAWTAIGPEPISNGSAGRVSTVAVHPTDPNTIYIGGAQGGVWKTTDSGVTWTSLTDDQCSLAMGSIAIDPVDPQIVYAGTGELHFSSDSYYGCGVLRSTDGGLTWIRLGAATFASSTGGARISRVLIDRTTAGSTTATTIHAASSTGLWTSRDSGLTWNLGLPGVISDIQPDAAGPSILYAAVGVPANSQSNGVYKSVDSGTTWERLTAFPTGNIGRIALGASTTTPGIVYAAVQDAFGSGGSDGRLLGIWRTLDAGGTWIERDATQANCNSQCWYDLVIAVDPTDDNTIWFGGVPMYRSTNGASTFQNVLRSAHVDQHAITFDPSDPSTIYIGNDGGIYRSRDNAFTWQSLNDGLAITQFYAGVSLHPTDTTIVLGGTQDNGTLEAGGSEVWRLVLGADGGFTAIDFQDATYSWAETQWTSGSGFGGPRLRIGNGSFDRRVNGIDTNDRALFIPPLVMDRNDAATLYFGTYRLYQTTTRGTTWTAISPDLSAGATTNGRVSAIAPSAADPSTIWVGTSDGRIQVTRDGGTTWDLRNAGLPRRFVTDIAVDAGDPETAVITVSGFDTGHVYRTTNGGVDWTDISGVLPNVPVNAVLTDPALGDAIYIGTDLGVFRSPDGSASWEPFTDGLPNVAVFDLVYNRSTGMAVAATHGRSIFAFRPTAASVVAISTDSVHLTAIGDTTRLAAVAVDLSGDTITGPVPAWRTTDNSVAIVTWDGLVTATGNGETSAIASFGGRADTASVTVRQVAVDIVDFPASVQLVEGETRLLVARPVDALGQTIAGDMLAFTSTDTDVATVDADGTVHAVGTGTATIVASIDQLAETSTVSVAPPSTAEIEATSASPPARPLSPAGTTLSLLRLDIEVTGFEPVSITRLDFAVSGIDPRATLFIVRDENGNGLADPTEANLASSTIALDGDALDVTLQPGNMRIEGGSRASFVVALRLSGDSPNQTTFQATYQPQATTSIGVRSGARDLLALPAAPVVSGSVTSTVLRPDDVLTFSENPVRSDRVIFNFNQTPKVAAIYTVTGRLVTDLTGANDTGRFEWDLRNTDGQRVAPGIYLVIFDVDGTVMRERLMVLPSRTEAASETPDSRNGSAGDSGPSYQSSAGRS